MTTFECYGYAFVFQAFLLDLVIPQVWHGPIYRYMIVTATGVTVLSIGAGVSDLTFLPAVGSTIDAMGISAMTIFVLGFGVACCALPILMSIVACYRGDRFERNEDENDEN